MRNFVVIGEARALVAQVLLALHSFTDANCIVICGKGSWALRLSTLCAKYMEADFHGKDDLLVEKRINALAEALPDLVVIPADCQGQRMLNRVGCRLQARFLAGPDSSSLASMDNKWCFYKLCMKHGLNVPPTCLVGKKSDLNFDAVTGEVGLPFVLKPVSQAASEGVRIIESEVDYRQKIIQDKNYHYAPLIAQKYIAGTDVGLNLLAVGGKLRAVAVQQRVGSKVRFFSNDYLVNVAHTIAGKFFHNGVMNVDARIEKGTGKVFLLESNPRFWRSLAASVWCGLNFVSEWLEPSLPGGLLSLTTGMADVYYYPLFIPALWQYLVFDRSLQGKMLRIMLSDPYMLANSSRTLLRMAQNTAHWVISGQRIEHVY